MDSGVILALLRKRCDQTVDQVNSWEREEGSGYEQGQIVVAGSMPLYGEIYSEG